MRVTPRGCCAAAALVMFMTPGLALFYGGHGPRQERAGDAHAELLLPGLVSVLWAVVVYSLAFGGTNKWIGNFDFAWMRYFNTAPPGLALYDPAVAVHGVPADVRGDHARA